MDRRSWLWRRKSSDKSSGETESLGSGSVSGSMSSPSERFSDEQQVYPIQNVQSPEVTSKHDSDTSDSVKILSEKLSAAVAAISEKEELVKQHAKVAEEAVNGWERAEDEMNALKQELDAAMNKNSTLEDKVAHLDGALKECLRQLRQVKEEQDQRIQDAIGKNSENSEPENSELQSQLADLGLKLASSEKENASLKLELRSQLEVLEVRTLERDLSTKRAETVSKQHLESIKKVAKLEAECRRLKTLSRKVTSFNDHKSPDDNGSNTTSLKTQMTSPSNVGLMDDFLEMEKLATSIEKSNENGNDTTSTKSELEERIEMVEAEKVELGLTLSQCQSKLHISESNFRQLQAQFNQCQNQLKLSQAQLRDTNKKLSVLRDELDLASELRQAIELELDDANVRREEAEAKCKAIENESKNLASKVAYLEVEAEKSRVLEDDLFKTKNELASVTVSKETAERELRGINAKKEAAETELKAVRAEVKSLLAKIGSLENEVEKEKRLSEEFEAKCRKLETEGCRTKCEVDRWRSQLNSANDLNEEMKRELQIVNAKKEEVETKLEAVQGEAESLFARVSSLEHEIEKERISSVELVSKCKKLEEELSKTKLKADVPFVTLSKEEVNLQQEKELAVAASKLAACQMTIASLGNQLKSLATLDNLFFDPDKQLDIFVRESQLP
ncbi:hypothetical protein RND81_04G212600 [Saponaria officinalis]|uniref:Filament-like plant protein 3 n=1 Tax=Saponaria officinalis TaxID=3572 RepID=A0AAW1LPD9_SAPOF